MNTPSKHQRDNSGDSDDVKFVKAVKHGALVDLASMSGFQHLPDELKSAILLFACSTTHDREDEGPLCIDVKTALSLMFVSHYFCATVKPLLYRHVKLDKPSKLADFGQTLRLQPDNGALVRSLHIGPLNDLPVGLWPRRFKKRRSSESRYYGWDEDDYYGVYVPFIKTSMNEEALLPCWCKPGREWPCESSRELRDCQDRAVADAIKAALEGVNIWLGHPEESDHDYCEAAGGGIGQVSRAESTSLLSSGSPSLPYLPALRTNGP